MCYFAALFEVQTRPKRELDLSDDDNGPQSEMLLHSLAEVGFQCRLRSRLGDPVEGWIESAEPQPVDAQIWIVIVGLQLVSSSNVLELDRLLT